MTDTQWSDTLPFIQMRPQKEKHDATGGITDWVLQINTLPQPETPSNASVEIRFLYKYHSKALSYPLQAAMPLMMNL